MYTIQIPTRVARWTNLTTEFTTTAHDSLIEFEQEMSADFCANPVPYFEKCVGKHVPSAIAKAAVQYFDWSLLPSLCTHCTLKAAVRDAVCVLLVMGRHLPAKLPTHVSVVIMTAPVCGRRRCHAMASAFLNHTRLRDMPVFCDKLGAPSEKEKEVNAKPITVKARKLDYCASCHTFGHLKQCGGCLNARYCDLECQQTDRDAHRIVCCPQEVKITNKGYTVTF